MQLASRTRNKLNALWWSWTLWLQLTGTRVGLNNIKCVGQARHTLLLVRMCIRPNVFQIETASMHVIITSTHAV